MKLFFHNAEIFQQFLQNEIFSLLSSTCAKMFLFNVWYILYKQNIKFVKSIFEIVYLNFLINFIDGIKHLCVVYKKIYVTEYYGNV